MNMEAEEGAEMMYSLGNRMGLDAKITARQGVDLVGQEVGRV